MIVAFMVMLLKCSLWNFYCVCYVCEFGGGVGVGMLPSGKLSMGLCHILTMVVLH